MVIDFYKPTQTQFQGSFLPLTLARRGALGAECLFQVGIFLKCNRFVGSLLDFHVSKQILPEKERVRASTISFDDHAAFFNASKDINNGSEFDLAWFFKIKLAALPGGALNAAKGALGAPILRDFLVRFL